MSDDPRIEHQFFQEYRRVFGAEPPRTLRLAYSVLAESLYFGLRGGLGYEEGPPVLGHSRRFGSDRWPFKDWRVIPLKKRADAALAQASALLRTWAQSTQPLEGRRGSVRSGAGGEHLDRDGESVA